MDDKIVSIKGYTHKELCEAFDLIKNSDHWKNPIDAWINPNRFDICNEACLYITGSALDRKQWAGQNALRVTAPGYFLTIGA